MRETETKKVHLPNTTISAAVEVTVPAVRVTSATVCSAYSATHVYSPAVARDNVTE